MSLYAQYLTERTEDKIIETEEGFVTYRFLNDKQIYIVDIFVVPSLRRQGIASRLADQIADIAKENGILELIGTVIPSTKGSTNSLRALLGYGFRLDSSSNDMIIFKKEI